MLKNLIDYNVWHNLSIKQWFYFKFKSIDFVLNQCIFTF